MSAAKRLYLVRHAEATLAEGQQVGHLFSTGDTQLSERGRQQASALAPLLADQGIDGVLTSPAKRARETAELLAAPLGLEVREDPGLHELPFAPPGTPYEILLKKVLELPNELRRNSDPMLAGGRRFSSVKARFQGSITRALQHHDRPLVVAHGGINRVYLAEAVGMPMHAILRIDQEHACLNVIEFGEKRPVVRKLNVTVPPL